MQKYKMFLPFVILFFVFNVLTSYALALTPLALLTNKKNSKVIKTKTNKKISFFKAKIKKHSKPSKSSKPEELKVSALLPEENTNSPYFIKTVALTAEVKENIMSEIIQWFGTKYKWGGKSEKGIDCSGFTSMIYEKVLGIKIPRSSSEQIKIGVPINDISQLRFGDLVFFKSKRRNPGHVGIYIGDGYFAHSSSGKGNGVKTSTLESYMKRYVGARRILDEPKTVFGGE